MKAPRQVEARGPTRVDERGLVDLASFEDGLVVHDDAAGPYMTQPYRPAEAATSSRLGWSLADVDRVLIPLPRGVFLKGEVAESMAAQFVRNLHLLQQYRRCRVAGGAGDAFDAALASQGLVLRTHLDLGNRFKAALSRREITARHEDATLADLYGRLAVPRFVWVTEITTPDLLRQGRIIGEFLWDATASEHSTPFLAIHYPGLVMVPSERPSLRQPLTVSYDALIQQLPRLDELTTDALRVVLGPKLTRPRIRSHPLQEDRPYLENRPAPHVVH